MAESSLTSEPAPYTDGGYVRRVLEVRGRAQIEAAAAGVAVFHLDPDN